MGGTVSWLARVAGALVSDTRVANVLVADTLVTTRW